MYVDVTNSTVLCNSYFFAFLYLYLDRCDQYKVGDYVVIVIYFVFVLLVGLWVSSNHFIEMTNTFNFMIIIITIVILSSLSSSSSLYISGLMAVKEKQCRRILPRLPVDALDARWCESLCFKHWVGAFLCVVSSSYNLWTLVGCFKYWMGGIFDACHISKS